MSLQPPLFTEVIEKDWAVSQLNSPHLENTALSIIDAHRILTPDGKNAFCGPSKLDDHTGEGVRIQCVESLDISGWHTNLLSAFPGGSLVRVQVCRGYGQHYAFLVLDRTQYPSLTQRHVVALVAAGPVWFGRSSADAAAAFQSCFVKAKQFSHDQIQSKFLSGVDIVEDDALSVFERHGTALARKLTRAYEASASNRVVPLLAHRSRSVFLDEASKELARIGYEPRIADDSFFWNSRAYDNVAFVVADEADFVNSGSLAYRLGHANAKSKKCIMISDSTVPCSSTLVQRLPRRRDVHRLVDAVITQVTKWQKKRAIPYDYVSGLAS